MKTQLQKAEALFADRKVDEAMTILGELLKAAARDAPARDQLLAWVIAHVDDEHPQVAAHIALMGGALVENGATPVGIGRAIVAPDQPNIREILVHEHTALLFDPADPAGLWHAVARVIADEALRLRLGANARAELERRDYTWRGNARRIAAMAEIVARQKGKTV